MIFEAELVNAVVPDALPLTTHSDDPALLSFCVFASQFQLSLCPSGLVMSMSRNSSGGTCFPMQRLSNTSCLIHCSQVFMHTTSHSCDFRLQSDL